TGQALVYHPGTGNTAIGILKPDGTLTAGQVYYAIVDPAQPDRIKLAATKNAAMAGNYLSLAAGSGMQTFAPVQNASQTFDPAAHADQTANTIDLNYSHGFATGEAVDYTHGVGVSPTPTDIGGLTNGTTYYAIVDTSQPTKLRLAATKADAL